MKTKLQIFGIALIGLLLTSCSSSMYMSKSSATPTDDIYYTPTKTTPSETTSTLVDSHKNTALVTEKQDLTKLDFASLEKKYSEILASDTSKIDTLIYKVEDDNPYERLLVDSYRESYDRRLNAKLSPSYGMSNLNIYLSSDYWYAMAFNPDFYHIVIMGDQIWVEPWYISNMFFTPRNSFGFGFGFGLAYWYPLIHSWNFNYWDFNGWRSNFEPYCYNGGSNNHHYSTNYFGRRLDNSTKNSSLNRRSGFSYEREITASRRMGGTSNISELGRVRNNTRNSNQTAITNRSNLRNNQEVINRGNRNENISPTRLRSETTSRNSNLTEPTRRNNNSTYQRPRSSNNDGYIRTGTRNQSINNGSVSRDNTTRNSSTSRENRNSSSTYNRPGRVDSSSDRGRTTNYGSSNRESNYRSSGRDNSSGSSSSSRTNSGTSSSSTTNSSTQQNSSSGRR